MLQLTHPEVRQVITECERTVRQLTGIPTITVSLVDPTEPLTFGEVEHIVCNATGVSIHDVYKRTRKTEVVRTRQLICFYARKHTSLSLSDIGKRTGARDHTTVMHSIQTIKNLLFTHDDDTTMYVDKVNRTIKRQPGNQPAGRT